MENDYSMFLRSDYHFELEVRHVQRENSSVYSITLCVKSIWIDPSSIIFLCKPFESIDFTYKINISLLNDMLTL